MNPDFNNNPKEQNYYNGNIDHILRLMRKFALLNRELTKDERSLFSQAIVRTVRARRDYINQLSFEQVQLKDVFNRQHAKQLNLELHAQKQIFVDLVDSILATLSTSMLSHAKDPEYVVFLQKINGDFNRYLAELADGDIQRYYAQHTMDAYKTACKVALVKLPVTNTLRMGLLLNFAVFFYDIAASPRRAVAVLNATIKDIIDSHEVPDAVGRMYIRMLQNNRDLWLEDLRCTVKESARRNRPPPTRKISEIISRHTIQPASFHSQMDEEENKSSAANLREQAVINAKRSSPAIQATKLKKRVSYASDVIYS